VRHETFCDGRLLKVFEQIDVTTGPHREADGIEFVDGQHFWKVDEQRVADDVASAMLARWGNSDGSQALNVEPGEA
jgi:hypothetical protein